MGNGGIERALTWLSWNEAATQPPEVLEQHLSAQKFCSKKETYPALGDRQFFREAHAVREKLCWEKKKYEKE